MSTERTEPSTGVLWWSCRVLAWMVILVVGALLTTMVLLPRIAGATPYTVTTGSMRPSMPPGTLVVVRPVDIDAIAVGTVITYQLRSGDPAVVTHRVTAVAIGQDGSRRFTTRGDANDVADREVVRPEQIRGALWYHVQHLGRLNAFVSQNQRHVALMAVVAVLLGYSAVMFASAARARLSPPRHRQSTDVIS